MSANNYLLIKENKEHPKYQVYMGDMDTGIDFVEDRPLDTYDTLEEAVKFATLYEGEEMVEYGIHFALLP